MNTQRLIKHKDFSIHFNIFSKIISNLIIKKVDLYFYFKFIIFVFLLIKSTNLAIWWINIIWKYCFYLKHLILNFFHQFKYFIWSIYKIVIFILNCNINDYLRIYIWYFRKILKATKSWKNTSNHFLLLYFEYFYAYLIFFPRCKVSKLWKLDKQIYFWKIL